MSDNQDNFDMDFDEKLEIEKLQATIRSMSNFTDDSEGFLSQSPKALMEGSALASMTESNEEDEFDPYAAIEKPVVRDKGPKAKKFVVMVDANNVEFFDKVPMEERTKLFNKLLSEYKNNLTKETRKKHLINYTKHLFVAIFTILLSLPVMFLAVNKSIQLTIKNYKNVQNNFEQLYETKKQNSYNSLHKTIY